MSGGTYYRVAPPKTYPSGRVCVAKTCTTRLSVYNRDHLCARCDEVERIEKFEAERLERLLERLLEEARG
jgi:hypothetical protein